MVAVDFGADCLWSSRWNSNLKKKKNKFNGSRGSAPIDNRSYLDCFMVPTVLHSPSSAHTYLKIFIYLDCFLVLSVSQSQVSSGAMLGYVFFFFTIWCHVLIRIAEGISGLNIAVVVFGGSLIEYTDLLHTSSVHVFVQRISSWHIWPYLCMDSIYVFIIQSQH